MNSNQILAQSADFTDSLGGKIFLAVVGALLTLGATLYINRRSARRAMRRLTWSSIVDAEAVGAPPELRARISVQYAGREVSSLATIYCSVTNDSQSGVRKHRLRFPAATDAKILEFYPVPEPEPELDFRDLSESGDESTERVAEVGYLGPGESITFLIVADGGDWLSWSGPRSSNPTEDVEFERRDVAQREDDRAHVRPFFLWGVVLFFAPTIFDVIPVTGVFGEFLQFSPRAIIASIIFVVFLLPHLAPVARVVAQLTEKFLGAGSGSFDIGTMRVGEGGSVFLGNTVSGGTGITVGRHQSRNGASEDE
ncbi:hypothetical protein [Pseudonocardia sp. ICBG1034]|uniref:hypothetical protein n=1 Tax=Pseudonocardia sp. ICBG1034 TaxID=2844381 RepID=UPI001CCF5705|nr:hypothetical protein [Pseudonocardia sp. ICBG1034]